MKKRIFIAIHYMEIGGAERSLLGLLNSIDCSLYDVDLFVYQHTGEFMKLIPNKINLLPENRKYSTLERPMLNVLLEGFIDIVLARLIARIKYTRFMSKKGFNESSSSFQYIANATTPILPSLKKYGVYDLAVSFVTPHNIVRDKVLAKKKIAWIHTDYSTIQINRKDELKVWSSFDQIVSISDSVTNSFLSCFPLLTDKIIMIENILSPSFVIDQSKLFNVDREVVKKEGLINLCSVGRFSYAKNFDNIPAIASELKNLKVNFKWYIIGYGGDEQLIRNKIQEFGMQERVIILGMKSNPYPYIKACDIYVQPSRFEGKAVTVREAQILSKPIVITNYPTAGSQIYNRLDGLIVEMDNLSVAVGIKEVAEDEVLRVSIVKRLETSSFSNEKEIDKFYKILDL